MSFFRIKNKLSDANRLRNIAAVVFEAGGGILIEKANLKYLVPLRCRIHCFFNPTKKESCLMQMKGEKAVLSPETLRKVLEKLGPTFIKLGQVLSLRADIVGEEISQELSKLQSDVATFSYEEARNIIKEELGKYPEDIFKTFEEKPVAAASLAQVHKATLKDGTEVAIKVQRPDINKIIEQDIHILFYLAHLAEKFIPEIRIYHPVRVIKEFADWTIRELNFKVEGNNADRFRFNFKENPHIKIPLIYWDFSSKRILTMEFVHGAKTDDFKGMEHMSVNSRQLALYGVGAMFQQFYIDGFFHADPHPGNFFALEGDILCLHDFGMVGYFTQEQRKELVSCFVAFIDKNSDGFFKHFMHLASVSEESDISGFQKDVSNILSDFFYSPNQPSVAWAFFRVINKGAGKNIAFPADLALFGKALITTEAMGLKLYPEFNLNKELKPFVEDAIKSYLDPKKAIQEFRADMFDYLEFLKTLPEKTQAMLSKIEKGDLTMKIDAVEILEFKREFDRQNDIKVLGVLIVAVFFAALIFAYLEGRKNIFGLPISTLVFTGFLALLIWFIIKVRKRP